MMLGQDLELQESEIMAILCELSTSPPAVPGYTLLEKLGAGGMGEVYLARGESGDRVAIKFLAPLRNMDERELRQRFERETRLMAQLSHPNIVRVLAHGHVQDQPYLVLEYVQGRSLRNRLTPGSPLPLPLARHVIAETANAISYLGEAGIVHRDLKPENVLLDEEDHVKVTDFGISVAVTEVGHLTRTAEVLGTVDYIAPEQRARLPVDPRADQFSLAVIVYETLTGKRPVGSFKPPSQLNRQLHPAVDPVLARALQEDPDDRYPDARDFAAALDRSLRRRPRRRLRAATWAAVVLTAALAIGFWVASGIHSRPGKPGSGPVEPQGRLVETQYFLDQGDRHLEAGRDRDAEACYTEAIRLSPRSPLPYTKRAFVYKKCLAYQQALDDLQTALRLDATQVDAWTGQGSIYVQLKDYERAVPALDQAVRLDGAAAEALAFRGWSQYKLGHLELAGQDLDAAVAADPACGVAYQFRAMFHQTQKRNEQALADYEAAVRCMPDHPFMHAGLAQLLAGRQDATAEDRQRAVEHARRACELTQWSDWRQIRFLATASAAAGDIPAAIRECEKALALAPVTSRKSLESQLAGYQMRADDPRKNSP